MYFIKNMNELSQILKKEDDDKNKLFLAEEKAKQEIEQKEKELKEKLEKETGLTESEKANLLAKKDQRIKEIEQKTAKRLQAELKEDAPAPSADITPAPASDWGVLAKALPIATEPIPSAVIVAVSSEPQAIPIITPPPRPPVFKTCIVAAFPSSKE